MSDESPAFGFVCEQLEAHTTLSRIEARGTVRLALREVGKSPAHVSIADMHTITTKVLPALLAPRGVRDGSRVCASVARALAKAPLRELASPADPATVFARLGGDGKPRR